MFFSIAIAVLGTWMGFANPVYRVPGLILLFPLAMARLAFLAPTPGKAAKAGMTAGTLAALGVLYWTAIPIRFYGNLPWVLALPLPVLLSLAMGAYVALFAAFLQPAAHRLSPFPFGLYAGALWTLTELARGTLFTGFSWLNLTAALVPWPFAVQGASILGAYALAGLFTACMAWLVAGRLRTFSSIFAILMLTGLAVYGNLELQRPLAQGTAFRVGIAQGNVDQSLKWDPAYQKATVDGYLALSAELTRDSAPALVVWPETAMPFYFQDGDPLAASVIRFARERGVPIVTGSPAYTRTGDSYTLYNRVYLVPPDGTDPTFYDKTHLVPFGEYIPFGNYLTFLSKLVHGVGDFQAGQNAAPLRYGDLALGILICYEAIFPELAQADVEAGANILVNVSNDAWFGRSAAPEQHLNLAALRAVEQGRFLVRATNTGISAVIDPRGRILAQSGLFTAESLAYGETMLLSDTTFFHRHRSLIHWTCGGLAAIFAALAALTAPRARSRKIR